MKCNNKPEFLTPVSKGKSKTRTRSSESNVKSQNETLLDYYKKFEIAEKNFSLEKLKKSTSNYDKLNKFNLKVIKENDFNEAVSSSFSVPQICPVPSQICPVPPQICPVPPQICPVLLQIQDSQEQSQEFLQPKLLAERGSQSISLSCCDKNISEVTRRKLSFQQNNHNSHVYKHKGSYWEFVIVMSHDKRLHWFTRPMNWIKTSGEILLYENNFKVLSRKFVICNFSVETPFVLSASAKVEDSRPLSIRDDTLSCMRQENEGYDVSFHLPNRQFLIDTSISYNFMASQENLNNFNLILFVIPNPVVLDMFKDDFNNGWKLITIVVPPLNLGVQNICHFVHEVPFPDKMYNRNGFHQPWWSYNFQIIWECNARKKSFAAWNAILEFDDPFEPKQSEGLYAKVLITSTSCHSSNPSYNHFVPRPSFCNHDSFQDGISSTIVKDLFLPNSIRCDGPCILQVPSFSYIVALPTN